MQFIKHIIPALATAVAIPAAAVNLEVRPGTLASLITDDMRLTEQLSLTGSMDQRDFDALDLLPALRDLDLSGVEIAEYAPKRVRGMMNARYEAATLPPGALLGKHLTALTLPASLQSIGRGALAGNDFTTITIPASVTSIDDDAFYGCTALESIHIPATVRQMGENMLTGCTALVSATFEGERLPRAIFSGCTALASVTLSGNIQEIGPDAFAACTSLKEITLPASLTSIGEKAFVLSGLETISLPHSLTQVGDYAFALCPALTTASFASVPTLGRGVFYYDTAIADVDFNAGESAPEEFPDYLFAGSTKLALPRGLEGVRTLGRYALKDNASATLHLGSTLEHLDDGAMEGMTSLVTVDASDLGASVPSLGEDVFAGIKQPEVTLLVSETEPVEPWQTAGQWNEFKIIRVAGIDTPIAPEEEIQAWFSGRMLHVHASQEIKWLQVNDASGRTLVRVAPGDTDAEIDMSGCDARVYIVTATTATSATTFKLTR